MFAEVVANLSDERNVGKDYKYSLSDAHKSALAVFYFQHPSLLNFQQEMKRKYKRSNLETLFGATNVPCTEQIKNIVDHVNPEGIEPVFDRLVKYADAAGIIQEYRVLDDGVLIPLDRVWYFSSDSIHCDHCLTVNKTSRSGKKTTQYYHEITAAAIVKPGCNVVLPLMPEFIRNEDGHTKQDSERSAVKRWLNKRGEGVKWLKPTFLGDDFYACYPVCRKILDGGMHFLFTCKPDSHPWIMDQVEGADMVKYTYRERQGRNHLEYRYQWLNNVELRADGENLLVNYINLEIWNKEKGETAYRNSWITNKQVEQSNIRLLVDCARARWKIENENNNVLKNRGYNLEHNFGHGKDHAAEIFCLMNLLGFLLHS
ncbi:MAG: ISNCY family transposase, partial [Oscillospiraceae bacterium]|nr:ISNCY family transposase [Oscillospiraceae bacterium]